ncbi:M23 family metallopeptidase [Pedobacter polaris]|uniref:M23 family metallopeptidase n=1 Tax=Pedobacter polaris TaxID=2571273 RepID=A0A4U1CXP3_9SPHI|nr:M23 family metallopeptidase [Pedobacter polaris]TKC13185.1 M23 family metallopeptidase [Pedobacter polaris]
MRKLSVLVFCFLLLSLILVSCKSGPFNLLKPATPHEAYERKLVSAGLNQTAMGTMWINNAQQSLQKALSIKLPFQEKGYFSADKIEAVAFKFQLTRGQKLQVNLDRKPTSEFMIYLDIWEHEGVNYKLIASADTLGNNIQLDVDKTGTYILRLQPELLGSGSYTLAITTGPSLGYPLKSANKNQIQSLYGVGRDEGARQHEGIDIFSTFRTPVLAVSAGTVTRVNSNNLGGKVVWFRPEGKNYTLYYAHLDEQMVTDGQAVLQGDTLGRMGNTGNAKTTPPHLHFGIYTNNGAIDPFPFINPEIQAPPKILSSTTALNATMRTNANAILKINDNQEVSLKAGTILRVMAATGNDYRIELPDGSIGYLGSNKLSPTVKAIAKYKINIDDQAVFDKPDTTAAIKLNLKNGEIVSVLGSFGDYQLVLNSNNQSGWINK